MHVCSKTFIFHSFHLTNEEDFSLDLSQFKRFRGLVSLNIFRQEGLSGRGAQWGAKI